VVKTRHHSSSPENHLGGGPHPLVYPVDRTSVPSAVAAPPGAGLGVRVWARSLSGMQKVALISTDADPSIWRVASDEGPYLNGFDAAPCPLSFMTVGLVANGLEAIVAELETGGRAAPGLEFTIDNRYTMEGSTLQGTMRGGALPLEVAVRTESGNDDESLHQLVAGALRRTPLGALVGGTHSSRFRLSVNGQAVAIDGVSEIAGTIAPPEWMATQPSPTVGTEPLIVRSKAVVPKTGVTGGAGTSLREEQRRELHVRGHGRFRSDGLVEVTQELHQPLGSTFRFLVEGRRRDGAPPRAPSGASYMAAGVAFCFMTQLERYATIVKEPLDHYEVIQDTRFSWGANSTAGSVSPVETHAFVDTPAGPDFARQCLRMGEQTCFLHALYRTPLTIRLTD